MLERIHDHIVSELGHSSRTDTIFVLVAILFDLVVLGINSATSSAAVENRRSGSASSATDIVLVVFILMTLVVNAIALAGLGVGRQTRSKLLSGLVAMYTDKVDKYYDKSLLSSYGTRYLLFGAVIVVLALTAIVVPLVIRWM